MYMRCYYYVGFQLQFVVSLHRHFGMWHIGSIGRRTRSY